LIDAVVKKIERGGERDVEDVETPCFLRADTMVRPYE
jgi:hypothetical protein